MHFSQTSAEAQVKGQYDKSPFRLRAEPDSAKKLYFSASSTYIIVSRNGLVMASHLLLHLCTAEMLCNVSAAVCPNLTGN